ncbi:hypothetical protein PILCRDRAFT_812766 [Piloderma croceum F 1598]|uniref:Uncharacterized protein n=1 Tax=Piloderma croceum (strain F 1598) TaxID=765440 RepID=A0A0C3GE58_PILCF|nr:hypothetical protein PILCRDRAFT_812766 [Piloderma croceum F 1598]
MGTIVGAMLQCLMVKKAYRRLKEHTRTFGKLPRSLSLNGKKTRLTIIHKTKLLSSNTSEHHFS